MMIMSSNHLSKHKYRDRREAFVHERCAYGQLFPSLRGSGSARSVVPRESDMDGEREYRHVGKE